MLKTCVILAHLVIYILGWGSHMYAMTHEGECITFEEWLNTCRHATSRLFLGPVDVACVIVCTVQSNTFIHTHPLCVLCIYITLEEIPPRINISRPSPRTLAVAKTVHLLQFFILGPN